MNKSTVWIEVVGVIERLLKIKNCHPCLRVLILARVLSKFHGISFDRSQVFGPEVKKKNPATLSETQKGACRKEILHKCDGRGGNKRLLFMSQSFMSKCWRALQKTH